MFYVYFIKSIKDNRFYVGYTNDLRRRFEDHNNGKSKYTKNFRPWKLVYYEAYETESLAKNRENKLKQHGKRYSAIIDRIEEN